MAFLNRVDVEVDPPVLLPVNELIYSRSHGCAWRGHARAVRTERGYGIRVPLSPMLAAVSIGGRSELGMLLSFRIHLYAWRNTLNSR